MDVPDDRVLWLSRLFSPETGIRRMDIGTSNLPRSGIPERRRPTDALIAVIPCSPWRSGGVFGDMETEPWPTWRRWKGSRDSGQTGQPVSMAEIPFLEKCKDALDNGVPLSKVHFEPHEGDFVTNFAFHTRKPIVVAVNASEESLHTKEYPGEDSLVAKASAMGYPVVVFSGEVESEIAALPEEDRREFLQEYGLTESGATRIAKACYEHLGLISFFTIGDDEVRAWTITRGTVAREAAGKIHTDMKRGFIRAEVIAFESLRELGSVKACRDKGLFRLEGKDYVVKDGDIVQVRFNV